MPGIGISPFKFFRRGNLIPKVTGISMFSATSPFTDEIRLNLDAGANNPIDESASFEFYATNAPLPHAGDSILVHVPAGCEIWAENPGGWTDIDFFYILGDGTGSNPNASMKIRMKVSGASLGTSTNAVKVNHADLPPNYTVFSIPGRVVEATNAKLITWQSALVGDYPSGYLMYHLDPLLAGMHSDGDLDEHDYFHLVAGMETDEQRLKPIVSSAGLVDADLIGSGAAPAVFDRTGIQVTALTQKTLRLKWKPITNGVKCLQNDNSLYCTFSASPSTGSRIYCGGPSTTWNLGKGSPLTSRAWNAGFASGNIFNAARFFGVRRDNSATFQGWTSQDLFQTQTVASAVIGDFYLRMPGANNSSDTGDSVTPSFALMHCMGAGSSLITFADVRTRLNTYYAALGLVTVN